MSHRPSTGKKLRKLRKSMRRSPDSFMDLIQWLIDHEHAASRREARALMVDGKVKADSHVVGRTKISLVIDGEATQEQYIPVRHIDSALRRSLIVAA